jgi:hypothetical protein
MINVATQEFDIFQSVEKAMRSNLLLPEYELRILSAAG